VVEFGFLTDETLCIGCKACEVACKQWNGLPAESLGLTGASYDNTLTLSATSWRHVMFAESAAAASTGATAELPPLRWNLLSDVCKHCQRAGCMDACPTGAIVRTEFGQVFVQPDICNGCGYCVPACPFGVIALEPRAGLAQKCTLCYDRLKAGAEPACAQACPTDSIVFGPVSDLEERGARRVRALKERGLRETTLYGTSEIAGGLNARFIVTRPVEDFNLPRAPRIPVDNVLPGSLAAIAAALSAIVCIFALTSGRR